MITLGPTGLPVEGSLDDLRTALAGAGRAVLVAPPGSGKTTVVPLRLLDAPWRAGRRIVLLEPRRVAARAAARRMASLLGDEVGATVGFTTRDERVVSERTVVEVVTEGVLTRRLQRDPTLADTALVVFDELHERNLTTDLGLALTLDALDRDERGADLRVLAMSATIDASRVAAVLGDAPVIEAGAPVHPVELRWLPRRPKERLEPAVAAAVRKALRETDGDAGGILVFLPGVGEINRTLGLLAEASLGDVDLRPLHGMLPATEQDAALRPAPAGTRKVVLSTDIAESSLTVEGVRTVIDSGLARKPRFDRATGLTRLTTIAISRASADQRAGRAGRLGPGVAYRLWSAMEHAARPAHRQAEITQVDLAGLALELAAWGKPPDALTWLDPSPARTYREGVALLQRLGALDDDGALTALGRAMLDLPLHPRLAAMVVLGAQAGQGGLAAALGALVDERDVLRGPPDQVPVDLALRVELLAGRSLASRSDTSSGVDARVDRSALALVRRRADDLARRIQTRLDTRLDARFDTRLDARFEKLDPRPAGLLLSLAYPDRIAVRRGSPGHFQLPDGTRVWIPARDPLAAASRIVVAAVDGRRTNGQVRLAARFEDPAAPR